MHRYVRVWVVMQTTDMMININEPLGATAGDGFYGVDFQPRKAKHIHMFWFKPVRKLLQWRGDS